jgi:transposase
LTSYFVARRIRGKRERGATGKTPVFGLLKRYEKVFTQIIKTLQKRILIPIIQGKILSKTTIRYLESL